MMQTRSYTVTFTTPAFLGNAEQSGQWRTPPFKHLLREWWRVAYAEARNYAVNPNALRQEEARLFGVAADEDGSSRSQLRLRLGRWEEGRLRQWTAGGRVQHPEVGRGGAAVGADLYLGYGPLSYDRNSRSTALKANAAIQASESNRLMLAFPEQDSMLVERSLELINSLGSLGGRSRNGWGSLVINDMDWCETLPFRDWRSCLDEQWPHAIGQDEQGALLWWTEPHEDWSSLMQTLAELKIGYRTQFRFHAGRNAERPEERHWLSYPVTNHTVKPWDQAVKDSKIKVLGLSNRLPNMLRFKVWQDADGYWGCIYHMPHLPPRQFRPDRQAIERVWQQVHRFLDDQQNLERQG